MLLTVRCLAVLVALFSASGAGAFAALQDDGAWRTIEERWYIIELGDERAGWASEALDDDGARYRSRSEQFLTFRRGPRDVVRVSMRLAMVETHAGEPVEIDMERTLAQAPERTKWTFGDDGVTEETASGRSTTTRRVDRPEGVWLMPRAAFRFEQARRAAGATEMRYRTLDLSNGLGVEEVVAKWAGEAMERFGDRDIPVAIWHVSRTREGSDTPSDEEAHVAEDGIVVRSLEALGPMRLSMRLATREEALGDFGDGPELLESTLIVPDRRIPGAHRATTAVYRLRMNEGALPELPSAGAQRIERPDGVDRSLIVRINVWEPLEASEAERADDSYLASTSLLDTADQEIIDLGQRALADLDAEADAAARAEALRVAVFEHISEKGLGAAFATASETVRSRMGDCSEHAVLLGAMLRTQGIPSRIASGLVYAENFAGRRDIFGWHMWTQALIDGRWIDLDATMKGSFSAGHILTGVSSMAEGAMTDDFGTMTTMMGNLEIEVVDVGYARRPPGRPRHKRVATRRLGGAIARRRYARGA